MGLDIYLLEPARDISVSWSYGSFHAFRARLAEAAGLGNLGNYKGFGGTKPWPSQDDEPLVALLNHSDCDGELRDGYCEGLASRLRAVVSRWAHDDYDRARAEQLADLIDRMERHGGVVEFR